METEMSKRNEAHRVQQGADKSRWGKPFVARPTADDVESGQAANVPFENLPESTQLTLKRRADARAAFEGQSTSSDFPHEGMFAGESDKTWGKSPEIKTEHPRL